MTAPERRMTGGIVGGPPGPSIPPVAVRLGRRTTMGTRADLRGLGLEDLLSTLPHHRARIVCHACRDAFDRGIFSERVERQHANRFPYPPHRIST